MKVPPRPENETERLNDLLSYGILDTEAEQSYDDLTRIAASVCDTPIALVSLLDSDRQWFKSRIGLAVKETPRDLAFCAHAILDSKPFIINDTLKDDRFADHPLVHEEPKIRFYAGIPLISARGYALGTLCVIDRQPKVLDEKQIDTLRALSRQVVALLELRLRTRQLEQMNTMRTRLLAMLSHDLKSSFSVITGFSQILQKKIDKIDRQDCIKALQRVETASRNAHQRLADILDWSRNQIDDRASSIERIDLRELCLGVIERMNDVATQKTIRIVLDAPQKAPILCDPCLAQSGIQNMLSNALKFSHPDSDIHVGISVKPEEIELTVADKGLGMEPELAEKIFIADDQHSGNGTFGETGSGVGTLLIKDFVNSCNGTLTVDTQANQGCCLTVSIPKRY